MYILYKKQGGGSLVTIYCIYIMVQYLCFKNPFAYQMHFNGILLIKYLYI